LTCSDIKDQTAGTLSQRITNVLMGLRGMESHLAGVVSYLQRVVGRRESVLPLNYPIIHSVQVCVCAQFFENKNICSSC
jgi:26S proteasome regulatory subunit N8